MDRTNAGRPLRKNLDSLVNFTIKLKIISPGRMERQNCLSLLKITFNSLENMNLNTILMLFGLFIETIMQF